MTKLLLAVSVLGVLSGCSKGAANALPPLPTIEKATLAYANCVDQLAHKIATQSGQVEDLAQRAVNKCHELRSEALGLKSVPVMFPTVAEFDATHLDLAQQTIASVRGKKS